MMVDVHRVSSFGRYRRQYRFGMRIGPTAGCVRCGVRGTVSLWGVLTGKGSARGMKWIHRTTFYAMCLRIIAKDDNIIGIQKLEIFEEALECRHGGFCSCVRRFRVCSTR
jgi:hypothetical protein